MTELPATYSVEITGMDCTDCARTLERGVGKLPGVATVEVDFTAARMHVRADPAQVSHGTVVAMIRELGYDVPQPRAAGAAPEARGAGALVRFFLDNRRARLALIAGTLWLVAELLSTLGTPELAVNALCAVGLVIGLIFPVRNGLAAWRAGRPLDMNALMTLGALGAAVLGEWTEAVAVIALFALGETLEAFTLDRARAGIHALLDLTPQEAMLVEPGQAYARRVPAASVQIGQTVRVAPGDRVPLDGVILSGQSALNEAAITGEAMPAPRGPGDSVYAGSINQEGSLDLRVTHGAGESTLARIATLVEQARTNTAPTQRWVDRFATVYTPVVVAGALVLAFGPPAVALALGQPASAPLSVWVYRALVLLVIACPCALVISTPVTIVAALAAAARRGILIKGGQHLESAGRVRAVAFDKTGTLTRGQPRVQTITPLGGHSIETLLQWAAAVERRSEHPLAQAVVREARHRDLRLLEASDFTAFPGRGARGRVDESEIAVGRATWFDALAPEALAVVQACEARGESALVVTRTLEGGTPQAVGVLAVADTVRPESVLAVRALHAAGITHTIMLTGDNATVAAHIAKAVGVHAFRASLMPEDKVHAIEELTRTYGAVAMVGDGINDAPALARAAVGVVMGAAGTDLALETADIALMHDDLRAVAETLALSREAYNTVRFNVAFALVLKLIFVALALAGQATLWMAVFADTGASLLVTLNGMRLLRFRAREIK